MGLFRKTNGEAAAPATLSKSEEIRRSMEPEIVILHSLKIDLEQAESQQVELRQKADDAKDANELSEIRKDQDFNTQTIERLKQSITAKEAELQPLKQACWAATEKERREREEREAAAFVESRTRDAYEAFTLFMKNQARFNELMNEMRKRGFLREAFAIEQDLLQKQANANMKHVRI